MDAQKPECMMKEARVGQTACTARCLGVVYRAGVGLGLEDEGNLFSLSYFGLRVLIPTSHGCSKTQPLRPASHSRV